MKYDPMSTINAQRSFKEEKKQAKASSKTKKVSVKKKKTAKKKKLLTMQQVKKRLDTVTSKIVRLIAADSNWNIRCISCSTLINWKEAHCCHFISRGKLKYRFDFENLRAGCCSCNKYHPEMHIREFTIKLIDQYWLEKVREMQETSKDVYKIWVHELREMLIERKAALKELEEIKKDIL